MRLIRLTYKSMSSNLGRTSKYKLITSVVKNRKQVRRTYLPQQRVSIQSIIEKKEIRKTRAKKNGFPLSYLSQREPKPRLFTKFLVSSRRWQWIFRVCSCKISSRDGGRGIKSEIHFFLNDKIYGHHFFSIFLNLYSSTLISYFNRVSIYLLCTLLLLYLNIELEC